MNRHRDSTSPLLITAVAVAMVFGAYFLWSGFMEWADENNASQRSRQTAEAFVQATQTNRPSPIPGATRTALPPCQIYFINVDAANVRECPSIQCDSEDRLEYETELCIYERASDGPYEDFAEWYVVDLNAGGVFTDLVYVHESVIEPRFPTPRPSMTFTALPTITPTPTPVISPTPTPIPACNTWYVSVSSANLRECPSADCPRRATPLFADDEVCVLETAAAYSSQYSGAANWYIIDLNNGNGPLHIWFMHESGIQPRDPSILTPSITPETPTEEE